MKQDMDWMDAMRSALRDAEATPPADGWARLERELNAPAPGISVWHRYWPRITAAAAAVLIFAVGGTLLLHENHKLGEDNGFVFAQATDGGSPAADHSVAPSDPKNGGSAAEALRELIPSQQAVRAATLPDDKMLAQGSVPAVKFSDSGANPTEAQPALLAVATSVPESTRSTVAVSEEGATATAASGSPAESAAGSTPAATSVARSTDAGPDPQTFAARAAGRSAVIPAAPADRGRAKSRSIYPDGERFAAASRNRMKSSLSLFAAGSVTGAGGTTMPLNPAMMMSGAPVVGSNGMMSQLKLDYTSGSFRHHQPLSFGLAVRKGFAHGLSLETGVTYTLLWSDVRVGSDRDNITQKLHFIGVPLRLNWQFFRTGNFSLYLGAGGMLEKCVSAKYGRESIEEPAVQWSAFVAAGAQYDLGRHVGLYFEPEGSYYFTDTNLRTSRTDSPLTLTLRLGVRLSF